MWCAFPIYGGSSRLQRPVTANERAVAIENRERYVPIIVGIAGGHFDRLCGDVRIRGLKVKFKLIIP